MNKVKKWFTPNLFMRVLGICVFLASVSLLPAAAPTMEDLDVCEQKIEYQNKAYFAWNDGANGEELWIWDVANGQNPLLRMNIRAGSASSSPREFVILNDKLYFIADDGIHGPEFWKVDGEAKPVLAYDFLGNTWNPRNLLVWDNQNKIYFITSQVFDTATYIYSYDGVNPPVLAPFITNNPGYWPTEQLILDGEYLLLFKNTIGVTPNFWRYDGVSAPVENVEAEYNEVPKEESGSTIKEIAAQNNLLSSALTFINFKVRPNIQFLRPTSAYMCWKLATNAIVHVKLATNAAYTENLREYNVSSGTFNSFLISNLIPNKKWYYSANIVNSSCFASGIFRTPVADGDKTSRKIVILGDTRGPGVLQSYGATARIQVDSAVYYEQPDLIIHLGDMAYSTKYCFDLADDFFSYFRFMLSKAAWLPTYGNHEFFQESLYTCSRVFSPNPYTCFHLACTVFKWYLFNPTLSYYRYDYQNIRFLNLFIPWDNSTAYQFYQPGSAQYNWILNELQIAYQDLQSGSIDFIIPIFHRPLATVGEYLRPKYNSLVYNTYAELFKQYGVQVVFSACAHSYQHLVLYSQNVDYYICGGGGTNLDHDASGGPSYLFDSYNNIIGKVFDKKKNFHYMVLQTGLSNGKPSITITENDVIKDNKNPNGYWLRKGQDSRTIVRN